LAPPPPSSNAKRCIKKYTDTWAPGDSVKVENAKCQAVQPSGGGRQGAGAQRP
jgi:hypothetical protein